MGGTVDSLFLFNSISSYQCSVHGDTKLIVKNNYFKGNPQIATTGTALF